MDFDIDNLDMLSGVDQLKELKKQELLFASALSEAKQSAYGALSKEADTKDPKRVKHKLTYEDVESIVVNVASFGLIRDVVNSKGNKPLLTVMYAIDKHVKKEKKHLEWAKKVKHRDNYGNSVKLSIQRMSLGDIEVQRFFQGIDLNIIKDSSTLNRALNKLVEEHEKVIEMAYLVQEDKLKTEKIISLEVKILAAEKQIRELKAGILTDNKDDWKHRATALLSSGVKQSSVADTVGMSVSSIRRLAKEIKHA
jgi:hypothetical protein